MAAKKQDTNAILTYVLMALLVVGAYFLGVFKTRSEMLTGGATPTAQQPSATEEPITQLEGEDWETLTSEFAYAFGDPNAPVTMVEFTDYQCPFCKQFFENAYPQVVSEYVDQGLVYYIIRDFPLDFHTNADEAAVAARCAGREGKYMEMHDMLFENQAEWETLADPTSTLSQYGDDLGLDIRSCQADPEVAQAVQDDLALGGQLGVSGTPSFFINGELLVGAQPFVSFQSVIDQQIQ